MLGTGKMGGAIARRVEAQGHALHLWNRSRARAEDLGFGTVHATPAEAASAADVVLSSLTGPEAVRDVYLGEDGALEAAAPGRVYVDLSTVNPEVHEEVARTAERRGARFVEAPVSGSVPAVESGKLLVLAAGDADAIDSVRPVLETLGEVRHVGPLGTGSRLKLVVNCYLGITHAAAAELLAAASSIGLDPAIVFPVLVRFVPALEVRRRGFLEHRHEPTMFAVKDLTKDLRLALEQYGRADAQTPITRTTLDLYSRTEATLADADIPAVAEIFAPGGTAAR